MKDKVTNKQTSDIAQKAICDCGQLVDYYDSREVVYCPACYNRSDIEELTTVHGYQIGNKIYATLREAQHAFDQLSKIADTSGLEIARV